MYPPPKGPSLTAEQARELDDTYLASGPFEYFRARIAALLEWDEAAPIASRTTPTQQAGRTREKFEKLLQRPASAGPFSAETVRSQVASEALTLRQHAAEALLRLASVRLAPVSTDEPECLWADVSTGPTQIGEVVKRLRHAANAPDASDRMFKALVPPAARTSARDDPNMVSACNVAVAWVNHAIGLLTPADIDFQAAHNKVKHGLAARTRSDMRVVFATEGPSPAGTIAKSALDGAGAINIFDQQMLEFLSRAPKVDGHTQGLELTQLNLDPSTILAESYMLGATHGLMFHVAAVEHFAGREDLAKHVTAPASPGYSVDGPKPEHIVGHALLGMRFPLTTPPGGGPSKRDAGMGFPDRFQVIHTDYESGSTATVVDDQG